ncbi:MAG: arginine--tRNA ligase [Anaerolineae bacterium]|nr:arginine--tRNA ligase [Anaerolineae bacterium]
MTQAAQDAQRAGALPPFDLPPLSVERPKQASHGDYASAAALSLARPARKAPLQIAQAIAQHIPPTDMLGKVEAVPPGFINLTLSDAWLARQADTILAAGMTFGNLDIGRGRKAQVEFVSANPTGPLTIGRTWGAVLGDVIANLLTAAGYAVTREYYFNNAGRQMRILGESVRARYLELLGHSIPGGGDTGAFPEEGYQGEYIYDIARSILETHGSAWAEEDWQPFKEAAEAAVFANIRATLQRFGLEFDVWFNESSLYATGEIERTLAALRERGYAYDADGAVWFRATAFGADKDRVLVKSSGEPTYRLPDIAYHVNKLGRGFEYIVNIFGADHKDEYPDVIAGVRALGLPADCIQVIIHQFINLVRDGKQVRMSTRRANYVTLDDLLDEVTVTNPETGIALPGKDPVRFILLTRSPDSTMNFDLELAKRQSNENPVYYVQYAHARIASILRFAQESGAMAGSVPAEGDVRLLTHPAEMALVRKMLDLQEVVEQAVTKLAPHHLSHYAQDLAATFHAFYRDCRVVSSEPGDRPLMLARLRLVAATQIVLARALGLMGMTAPERM